MGDVEIEVAEHFIGVAHRERDDLGTAAVVGVRGLVHEGQLEPVAGRDRTAEHAVQAGGDVGDGSGRGISVVVALIWRFIVHIPGMWVEAISGAPESVGAARIRLLGPVVDVPAPCVLPLVPDG